MRTLLLPPMVLPVVLGAALALAAPLPAARADEAPSCRLHRLLSSEQQLRRTSLALRGTIPQIDEYALVEGEDEVPEEVLDAYLASDEYRVQMRRFHEQILWPNPSGSILQGLPNALAVQASTGLYYINDPARRREYRGGNGGHVCQDVPQSVLGYEPDGLPTCEHKGQEPVTVNGNTTMVDWCQEGYELVRPYWDPGSEIKVCAFEAQSGAVWQPGPGMAVRCDYLTIDAASRRGCGCGPNLDFCGWFEHQDELWQDMREQLLLVVDDHTRGERPYSELLTTKRTYLNGRLAHFKKHLAQQAGYAGITYNVQHTGDAPLPADPDWTDESWIALERSGVHSGILTLPAFTLRFQTNRGRANRFRIAFMDQYFVPPAAYDTDHCDPAAKDLTERCVCNSCHRVLEPLAAHFGQVAEAGSGLLSDLHKVCPDLDSCLNQLPEGKSTALFNRFYATDYTTVPQTYRLRPLELLPAHPEYEEAFDRGPGELARLALEPVEGKSYSLFARATVKNLFAFIVGRSMNLDPASPDNEIATLDELAGGLSATDDFALLVRRIVRLEAFRRMP